MGFSPNDPNAARDRANMMMAVVISLFILLGFHFFVDVPRQRLEAEQARAKEAAEKQHDETAGIAAAKPSANTTANAAANTGATMDGASAAAAPAIEAKRIPVQADRVSGTLSTQGGRIDDLSLNDQYITVERQEHVPLLTPLGTEHPKYIESGWLGDKSVVLPTGSTVWTLAPGSAKELVSNGAPVVMQWDNGHGLHFERSVTIDENYLFTIKQSVRNNTGEAVKMLPYHAFAHAGLPPDFRGFFTLHEGPVAYLNGDLKEISYSDLAKGKKEQLQVDQAKGWIGITDKYWMVTLIPDPAATVKARAVCKVGTDDCSGGLNNPPNQQFQTDIRGMEMTVEPGATQSETTYVYAGVKNLKIMQAYQEKYGVEKLELGLDFGMYYIITKPFYYILHWLIAVTGNVGLAILLMTVVVRAFVFPLASKSFRSMAKMKIIAPKLKEIQTIYKDDKVKMQEAVYELYRKENANPFSGCWPILVQIPIIFALYKVILISVDLRHAPFWGWIHDLSAPDPTTVFNLFGHIDWQPPPFLMIGGWPLLFCLTMVMQKRITPPMTDATQERLQTYFPFIATLMMAQFPSGLLIYWTWSNVLSFFQQYYILRKFGGEDTSLLHGHADRRKQKKKKPGTPPEP